MGTLPLTCYSVVWKIDLHLITALFGIFIFNILDRSNIASARLGGLQKDLKLSDTQYQTAVSIMVCRTTQPHRCFYSLLIVCRVSYWPDSKQPYSHQTQPFTLPAMCYHRLGWSLSRYRRCEELQWNIRSQILDRLC
jgi:hypothetical protein